MKLGVLITTDRHLSHVVGLVSAAVQKGHEPTLFCMDRGTRLLIQNDFLGLCKQAGVTISICQHSADELAVDTSVITRDIVCGSQFNNAMMCHEADKVIVL